MGLDISVRTRLVFMRPRINKDDYPPEYENSEWICQQNPKCFQRQVADLEPGFYKADCDMGFAAGSYSGYN